MAEELNNSIPEVTSSPAAAEAVQVQPEGGDAKGARRMRTILTIILIVLIILLLLACAALYALLGPKNGGVNADQTNGIEWIRSVYGYGTNPDQLMHPTSVSVAPGGQSFWVSDASEFRLIQYNMNGTFRRLVTKDADGTAFQYPSRVAVAPNGWFYVAQQSYNNVLVFDKNFKLQNKIEIEMPLSLAVNNDMLAVGSQGGFAAFKPDGSFIGKVGEKGAKEGQFDTVSSLALDNKDNLYVLDTYNNRLSKYDAAGDQVWIKGLGQAGNSGIQTSANMSKEELEKKYPSNLQVPMGITLDANNRVIVIDLFDYSVSAFMTKDGSFISKWGEYGTGDGFFSNPSEIAYNKQQDVFLSAEPALGRVQIFRLEGSSSGNALTRLLQRYSDILRACWIPLLIIIVIIVIYIIARIIARRRRNSGKDVVELEEA